MFGRHRGHPHRGVASFDDHVLPGLEGDAASESVVLELFDGVGSGDDRHALSQVTRCTIVEVVAVVVRQHDEIDEREVGDLHRRFGQSLGPEAHAEPGVLATMEEVRIGQDGESPEPDQRRGRADEQDVAVRVGGDFRREREPVVRRGHVHRVARDVPAARAGNPLLIEGGFVCCAAARGTSTTRRAEEQVNELRDLNDDA